MGTLVFLALVFGVMYVLIIRPNQRRMKEHRDLLAGLEVGDVVVTSSGIYGAIAEIEDQVIWLEVAPEIELKITKTAVAERFEESDEDDDELEAADASDDEG